MKALLTPVPSAPNAYAAALCQGEYSGHELVAFGAGRRLVIARRDAHLSIVHVSAELPGEITAVSWSRGGCGSELGRARGVGGSVQGASQDGRSLLTYNGSNLTLSYKRQVPPAPRPT